MTEADPAWSIATALKSRTPCAFVVPLKDSQGALVPNAQVTVVNTLTQQTFSAVADDKGHWAVPALPTATYSVSVSASTAA